MHGNMNVKYACIFLLAAQLRMSKCFKVFGAQRRTELTTNEVFIS